MELQKYISKFLIKRRKALSEKQSHLTTEIHRLTGVSPRNIELYQEAFTLKGSSSQRTRNYERLEFLGDSILGSIVSCYLFENYPTANEGQLTQLKSKIVNRKNLNKIGEDLNLTHLLQNSFSSALSENLCGNLLEAFIGALYLDMGYELCSDIVLNKLLTTDTIHKLENKIISYKGLLLEWSQKRKLPLRYETCEEVQVHKNTLFRSSVYIEGQRISNATDSSKKKAEEKAAQRAFYALNKREHIVENQKIIS